MTSGFRPLFFVNSKRTKFTNTDLRTPTRKSSSVPVKSKVGGSAPATVFVMTPETLSFLLGPGTNSATTMSLPWMSGSQSSVVTMTSLTRLVRSFGAFVPRVYEEELGEVERPEELRNPARRTSPDRTCR